MHRTLFIALCLCLAASLTPADRGAPVGPLDAAQVASAVKAAVAAPQRPEIVDHYGDPDRFIQYIIRRPPTFV